MNSDRGKTSQQSIRPNPLFERRPEFAVLASSDTAPLSPIDNRQMVKVYCGDVEAWADLENRIAIPVFK